MRKITSLTLVAFAFNALAGNSYAAVSEPSDNQPKAAFTEVPPTQTTEPAITPQPAAPVPKPIPEAPEAIKPKKVEAAEPAVKTVSISAYTGKITKNKVRMRLQPTLDSIIVRELNTGDMLVVVGENEDFYAVKPPSALKGFIFRTFVLDGVIEGNHVNVRLEPDLSSPVIAQLNSGDRINGSISNRDKKWIEIPIPEATRFYISKEFIEKIGDAGYLTRYNKRRSEVTILLTNAKLNSQIELQKPFSQVNIDGITKDLQKVVTQYADFTDEAAQAKELLTTIQTAYLSKKVAYMEENQKQVAQQEVVIVPAEQMPVNTNSNYISNLAIWQAAEQPLYDAWVAQNGAGSTDDFYNQETQRAVSLKGVIEPYNRPIKNKPGDYVLISAGSHLPVAYLYSTRINLADKVGKEVSITGVQRDGKHFAYPAYFVLTVE